MMQNSSLFKHVQIISFYEHIDFTDNGFSKIKHLILNRNQS